MSIDLKTALAMFQKGMQDMGRARTISAATDAVNQINSQINDETERRTALQGVSNQLAMQLAAQGTPASTLQTLQNAIVPSRDPMAMQMELQDRAAKLRREEADIAYGRDVENREDSQAHATRLAQLKMDNAIKLAQTKATGKGAKARKLDAGTRKNVDKFSGAAASMRNILRQSQEHPEWTGGISAMIRAIPLPLVSDAASQYFADAAANMPGMEGFRAFKQDVDTNFQEVRKAITGAQASDRELQFLRPLVPDVRDWDTSFQRQAVRGALLSELARARTLINASREGTEIEHHFTNPEVAQLLDRTQNGGRDFFDLNPSERNLVLKEFSLEEESAVIDDILNETGQAPVNQGGSSLTPVEGGRKYKSKGLKKL